MTRAGVLAVLLIASPAWADRVGLRVTDVAGGVAYVSAGRRAGIAVGAQVRFGAAAYPVIGVTETAAAVDLGGAAIAIGATGEADANPGDPDAPPAVRPAAAFVEQWPTAVAPATTQAPAAIPLAAHAPGERTQLELLGTMYGTADHTGGGGQAEARVIASFALMQDHPLGADLDVAARAFGDGWNAHEREPWMVYAAQLRYGDAADPMIMVGRLRYAATAIGMLDGGRAAVHVGDLELAAFGGLVPDPINGKPDTGASRFGAEAIFDRADAPWQPRVSLTAYGSTWDGQLDERRLSLAASATHGALTLDGFADAQQFPSGNPFGASAVELTGAGASGSWRSGGWHFGVDTTFLRPDRSLRLLAAGLWECTRAPLPGSQPEACTDRDTWYAATASAGIAREHWAVDAVGSVGRTRGVVTTDDASGYLRGELRGAMLRVFAALSGGRTEMADWIAPELGVGADPSRRFGIAVSYRPERLDYVAATGAIVMQSVVLELHYAVTVALDLALSALGSTGGDGDSFEMIGTVAWRPKR